MSLQVEARGVTYAYQAAEVALPVLQGVDLDIHTGSFAVIAGPSGSGKTTLLNLIGGLDAPHGGTLRVCGVELHGTTERQRLQFRREHVAWVFQFFHLLPVLSALENVQIVLEGTGTPRSQARERAVEALGDVGLGTKLDRLPSQLSGGEQQRVGLARALAKRPHLVLADEPTGALDRGLATEIVEVLQELRQRHQTTLAVVTHDPVVIEAATELFELTGGRVHREGG